MNRFFSKLVKQSTVKYDSNGIEVFFSEQNKLDVAWENISKVIFVSFFEEYSGYFLTEDYRAKQDYDKIYFNNVSNTVKVRTGSNPYVKKNSKKPFETPHGTTNILKVIFIEYKNNEGGKGLYVVHYREKDKQKCIKELSLYLGEERVLEYSRLDGFDYIPKLD